MALSDHVDYFSTTNDPVFGSFNSDVKEKIKVLRWWTVIVVLFEDLSSCSSLVELCRRHEGE